MSALTRVEALAALAERRRANAGRPKIDNASLPAGAPMFFSCLTCDAEIGVPEGYLTRPTLCRPCQDLKECGWLE